MSFLAWPRKACFLQWQVALLLLLQLREMARRLFRRTRNPRPWREGRVEFLPFLGKSACRKKKVTWREGSIPWQSIHKSLDWLKFWSQKWVPFDFDCNCECWGWWVICGFGSRLLNNSIGSGILQKSVLNMIRHVVCLQVSWEVSFTYKVCYLSFMCKGSYWIPWDGCTWKFWNGFCFWTQFHLNNHNFSTQVTLMTKSNIQLIWKIRTNNLLPTKGYNRTHFSTPSP